MKPIDDFKSTWEKYFPCFSVIYEHFLSFKSKICIRCYILPQEVYFEKKTRIFLQAIMFHRCQFQVFFFDVYTSCQIMQRTEYKLVIFHCFVEFRDALDTFTTLLKCYNNACSVILASTLDVKQSTCRWIFANLLIGNTNCKSRSTYLKCRIFNPCWFHEQLFNMVDKDILSFIDKNRVTPRGHYCVW